MIFILLARLNALFILGNNEPPTVSFKYTYQDYRTLNLQLRKVTESINLSSSNSTTCKYSLSAFVSLVTLAS